MTGVIINCANPGRIMSGETGTMKGPFPVGRCSIPPVSKSGEPRAK